MTTYLGSSLILHRFHHMRCFHNSYIYVCFELITVISGKVHGFPTFKQQLQEDSVCYIIYFQVLNARASFRPVHHPYIYVSQPIQRSRPVVWHAHSYKFPKLLCIVSIAVYQQIYLLCDCVYLLHTKDAYFFWVKRMH